MREGPAGLWGAGGAGGTARTWKQRPLLAVIPVIGHRCAHLGMREAGVSPDHAAGAPRSDV